MKHSLFSELKTGTAGQWLFLFGGIVSGYEISDYYKIVEKIEISTIIS